MNFDKMIEILYTFYESCQRKHISAAVQYQCVYKNMYIVRAIHMDVV